MINVILCILISSASFIVGMEKKLSIDFDNKDIQELILSKLKNTLEGNTLDQALEQEAHRTYSHCRPANALQIYNGLHPVTLKPNCPPELLALPNEIKEHITTFAQENIEEISCKLISSHTKTYQEKYYFDSEQFFATKDCIIKVVSIKDNNKQYRLEILDSVSGTALLSTLIPKEDLFSHDNKELSIDVRKYNDCFYVSGLNPIDKEIDPLSTIQENVFLVPVTGNMNTVFNNPTNPFMFTFIANNAIRVFNTKQGELLENKHESYAIDYTDQEYRPTHIKFTPDGSLCCITCTNPSADHLIHVQVWKTDTMISADAKKAPLAVISLEKKGRRDRILIESNSTLIHLAGDPQKDLHADLFDLKTGALLKRISLWTNDIKPESYAALQNTPEGRDIIRCLAHFCVEDFSVEQYKCVNAAVSSDGKLLKIEIVPDKGIVKNSYYASMAQVWDLEKGICVRSIKNAITLLSPDGKFLNVIQADFSGERMAFPMSIENLSTHQSCQMATGTRPCFVENNYIIIQKPVGNTLHFSLRNPHTGKKIAACIFDRQSTTQESVHINPKTVIFKQDKNKVSVWNFSVHTELESFTRDIQEHDPITPGNGCIMPLLRIYFLHKIQEAFLDCKKLSVDSYGYNGKGGFWYRVFQSFSPSLQTLLARRLTIISTEQKETKQELNTGLSQANKKIKYN